MEKDLSAFRPTRIWKRLTAERRLAAAEVFWADEQSTEQKFRTKSVVGLPLERKAKYLATFPGISDTVAARALVSYHLEHQRGMMAEFLDALGIAHEDGLINDETVAKPEPDRVREAAAALAAKYPAEDVSLYLSTLISQDPETWEPLTELPQTTA